SNRLGHRARTSLGPLWALFAALGLLMLGNGLQSTLVGIRTQLADFGGFATALVMASYFAGFLGSSFVVPRIVARVGHIRVFAALASSASVAALVYTVTVHPVSWALMRFLTGACMAGLYVVVESWLNTRATNQNRGRLLAIYMVVVMVGLSIGQLFLNLADPAGFELFILSSVLISLAVVPLSLSQAPAPEFQLTSRIKFAAFARMAPLAVVAGLLTGASNGAIMGMGAVYATRAGLSTGAITVFMSMTLLGGVALQWPLGWLSDRLPRRRVLLGVSLAATAVAVAATRVDPAGPAIIALTFLYGGLAFPTYSLAISHINDVVPRDGFVGSAATFLFINGVGAIIGPIAVSGAMAWTGPTGYWWVLALFYAPVAVMAVYRIARRVQPNRGRFAYLSPRSSSAISDMLHDFESQR
ncbi:MAG: MFS transporter, partial [Acidimicrobiia bacterium]|nr:MFS transporter [Acidimicrobiia bacterium]